MLDAGTAHRPPQSAGHLHAALQPPDPAGRGAVVHYELQLPDQLAAPVTVEVKLQYRKFDARLHEVRARASGGANRSADHDHRRRPRRRSRRRRQGTPPPSNAASRHPPGNAGTTTASACCSKGQRQREGRVAPGGRRPSPKSNGSAGRTGRSTWPASTTRRAGSTTPSAALQRAAAAGAPLVDGRLAQWARQQAERLSSTRPSRLRARARASSAGDARTADSISAATTKSSTSSGRPCSSAPRRREIRARRATNGAPHARGRCLRAHTGRR